MTAVQEEKIKAFQQSLDDDIQKTLTWGGHRTLNLFYFTLDNQVYLQIIESGSLSNDFAGMSVMSSFYVITESGDTTEISESRYKEFKSSAKEIISCNPGYNNF